ncbi:MAG: bifunctional glutamate N-acetyltransferase/amino-acid acetyltransferase ArgJ [Desulfosarcinaceae bacterium]|nr:bifunctional glutamate N-acetyltransferase/amino-acid acetyltransferase ArgJ [Desulfosarcinaceae bacterium]
MEQTIQCPGFRAAGVACGLKPNGDKDLGLIVADRPASVAGVFTRNRVKAAPVQLCQERLAAGTCSAVIINSGNANCATGAQGRTDAEAMARIAAEAVGVDPQSVLVASTGVIGQPLPIERIRDGVPTLVAGLRHDGFGDLARAMMTTDTVPKAEVRWGEVDGKRFTVAAVAKGAGMIRPDMATMLAFVCTDVAADPRVLRTLLQAACDRSFNRISIDGDTSTNDTVLLMASGVSGIRLEAEAAQHRFQSLLDEMLLALAKQLVKDGEGVTKVVEIRVHGAADRSAALKVADTIAHSPLVKTAFFGEDANWGRILAAAGRSGIELDPDRVDIYFDDVQMAAAGQGCGDAAEARAAAIMKLPAYAVTVDLHAGDAAASLLTCDFSVDYVKINADYRS